MTVLRKLMQRKTAYLPLGLVLAGLAVPGMVLGAGARQLMDGWLADHVFAYAVATGSLLTAHLLWQWRLYFVRRRGDPRTLQRTYRQHRWLGLLPLALLVVHIGGPSGSLLSIMSWVLMASCLSGLFNQEIFRQKTSAARKAWLSIHVGTAALVVPLVLLHVWAAFAFKGP